MYQRMKLKLADIDNNDNFKDDCLYDLIQETKDPQESQRFIDQQFPFKNVSDFHEWLAAVYGQDKIGFYKKPIVQEPVES